MILQEKPGQEEYQTVTEILKTQTELLQVGDQEQLLPFTFNMNARSATADSNNFVWYSFFSAARLQSRKSRLSESTSYGPFTFPMEIFYV